MPLKFDTRTMNDAILEKLALQVLGWERDMYGYIRLPHDFQASFSSWRPLTSLHDAWMLLNAIRPKPGGATYLRRKFEQDPLHFMTPNQACSAIVRVALEWLERSS